MWGTVRYRCVSGGPLGIGVYVGTVRYRCVCGGR